MKNNINTRTAKVFIDNEYIDIDPIDLKKGMKFRIFESDGLIVGDHNGTNDFIAKEDAYYDDNGIITIKCWFHCYFGG